MYPAFQTLRAQVNQAKGVDPFYGTLIALDPGETTGYAIFYIDPTGLVILRQGQLATWPFEKGFQEFTDLIDLHNPKAVVHEAYRVYEWKATSHSWSDVPTLQLIGCVKTLLLLGTSREAVPVYVQTAQVAKTFCTDEKLKSWGMWVSGQRHARDAVRHGCYFLLFGPSKEQS